MLEINQAKITVQNKDLIRLKTDVDTALTNSITMFNDEKDKLQLFFVSLLQTLENTNSLDTNTHNNSKYTGSPYFLVGGAGPKSRTQNNLWCKRGQQCTLNLKDFKSPKNTQELQQYLGYLKGL